MGRDLGGSSGNVGSDFIGEAMIFRDDAEVAWKVVGAAFIPG